MASAAAKPTVTLHENGDDDHDDEHDDDHDDDQNVDEHCLNKIGWGDY